MQREFTAIIECEGDWFVALCPELDIASQGKTFAQYSSQEAFELFLRQHQRGNS
jgi:predicted RNase H-like HicB family nuclease